jgi:hypothetical protein
VSGLAHYLEEDGLATTTLAFVRPHVEAMGPPRALWVPFELGKPFGEPNDLALQMRVLRAVLDLLKARSGPVLEYFPDDVSNYDKDLGWSCRPPALVSDAERSDPATLLDRLKAEDAKIRPAYEKAVVARGRSTVGASRVPLDDLAAFLVGFLGSEVPASPVKGQTLPQTFRFALDDLMAYYTEAKSFEGELTSSTDLGRWFWGETAAGRLLIELEHACRTSPNKTLRWLVEIGILVPHYPE